jgi:hypothetical protein
MRGHGPTIEAVKREIGDATRFHVAGLQEDGLAVPYDRPRE